MTDNPSSAQTKRTQQRRAIVECAMKIACFDGWNDATIAKAATAAGLNPLDGSRLFSGGVGELFICHAEMLDARIAEEAHSVELSSMRVHERIAWLIKIRLNLLAPNKEAIRRAIAWQAIPWTEASLAKNLWTFSDSTWRMAGDQSTDFNYYTKRGLLAKVYASTLLFWLNDESHDHYETWEFLERRIQAVLTTGKQMGQMQKRLTSFIENTTDQLLNRRKYRTKR
jgi:ubiquinone biosynthesis protein COQ9